MSCLEFPGATFCGIHDDCDSDGLASMVRECIPEDSILVELDSGEIKCDGNRYDRNSALRCIYVLERKRERWFHVLTICRSYFLTGMRH